jgi:phosphoribosylformimino-5-aminoimidazole carboxamide ribonucleotide (ProFAR) isomerase
VAFTVFPSIHIRQGQVVHLMGGQSVPGMHHTDPLEVALTFQDQGAQWVHLVVVSDQGYEVDFEAVARIARTLAIDVQAVFWSVTNDAGFNRALATNCARINLCTAALEDTDWCAEVISAYGDRIGVSTLVRTTPNGPRLTTMTGADIGDLWDVLERLEPAHCARYVLTDTDREGSLSGPNLPLFREVCAKTGVPVLAAGGIRDLTDLRAVAQLAPCGVVGALVGRALFTGSLPLPQALTV